MCRYMSHLYMDKNQTLGETHIKRTVETTAFLGAYTHRVT